MCYNIYIIIIRMSTDLDIILKKYKQGKREDLIPLLQEIQEDLGYLSEEAIVKIGSFLGSEYNKDLWTCHIL